MRRPILLAIALTAGMIGATFHSSRAQETKNDAPATEIQRLPPTAKVPSDTLTSPASQSSNHGPTVRIQSDGGLMLRQGGPETPFVAIEAAELNAQRVGGQHVTIQTQGGVPENKLQDVTGKLKAAGATRIELLPPMLQVRIVPLANSSAVTMAALLKRLFDEVNISISADERTNAIIVLGPATALRQIEAVALRLDLEAEPAKATTRQPTAAAASSIPAFRSNSGEYQRHEQRATQLANQLWALGSDSNNVQQRDRLQGELRSEVEAAFEARQQQQREEVSRLGQRLAEIERSITARERLKPEIVSNRVAELIDPNRKWEPAIATSVPAAKPAVAAPAAGIVKPSTPAVALPTSPAGADPFAQNSRGRAITPGNAPILRNAEEYSRELAAAEKHVQDILKVTSRGYRSEADFAASQRYAQRRLEAIQAEYAAQLKLLELEIQSAKASLGKAQLELANTEKLHAVRVVSQQELEMHQFTFKQAQVRLDQLNTLYELYRGLGQLEGEKPGSSNLPGQPPGATTTEPASPDPAAKPTSKKE